MIRENEEVNGRANHRLGSATAAGGQRRAYAQPTLDWFGDVRDITLSASFDPTATESTTMIPKKDV